jgi:hypothetical protein
LGWFQVAHSREGRGGWRDGCVCVVCVLLRVYFLTSVFLFNTGWCVARHARIFSAFSCFFLPSQQNKIWRVFWFVYLFLLFLLLYCYYYYY